MTFYPVDGTNIDTLKGFTVILPAVSVGIVGCNTIDLLLVNAPKAALDLKLVGYYDDPFALQSFAGRDLLAVTEDEMKGQLHFGIEVYADYHHRLLILQQRAPSVHSRGKSFAKQYTKWVIEQLGPQVVINLTSITSRHRTDIELQRKDVLQFFTVEPDVLVPPPSVDEIERSIDQVSLLTSPTTTPLESQQFFPDIITPSTPPAEALQQPYASILHQQLQVPYTVHNQEHLENHHRVKQLGHYNILYSDYTKLGSPTEGKNKPGDDDAAQKSSKTPLYFPFPIKGGGITHKLAKECNKHKVPVVGITALTASGDVRHIAHQMTHLLVRFLCHVVPSLGSHDEFSRLASADHPLKAPHAWKGLYEEDPHSFAMAD